MDKDSSFVARQEASPEPRGPMSDRILISSSLPVLRQEWSRHLEERGHDVIALGAGANWLEDVLRSPVDLILFEDGSNLTRLLELTSRLPEPRPWIFLLRSPRLDWSRDPIAGEADTTLRAEMDVRELGVAGRAPDDLRPEVLSPWIETVLENRRLAARVEEARRLAFPTLHGSLLSGSSKSVRRLREELDSRLADPRPIVLVGESGSGRAKAASWIHFGGPRSGGPFLGIGRSEIHAPDIGRRLFGSRVEGRHRPGWLEQTHGGSLHLADAGRLPHSVQEDLGDFLRTGQVFEVSTRPSGEPVVADEPFRAAGSDRGSPIRTHTRILLSMERPLAVEASEGWLTPALLDELRGNEIFVPPLRERTEDVPALARAHLDARGLNSVQISGDAAHWLQDHVWRGHLTQLEQHLDRALSRRKQADFLHVTDLSPQTPQESAASETKTATSSDREAPPEPDPQEAPENPNDLEASAFRLPESGVDLADLERDLIEQALDRANGNQSKAARLLGLSRQTLIYRIQKHGITR